VDRKTASPGQFQIESPQIPQEEDQQQKEEQRKGEAALSMKRLSLVPKHAPTLQWPWILQPEQRTFVIKPIPTLSVKPVIVFINPKSGGNQGAKLLQKFQWLLNPRQVFDLTQGGPKMG
jgi:hypothetical protein